MPDTAQEIVIRISQTFRDLAGVFLNTAYQAYKNGQISERDFWLIRMDYYEPILHEGAKILMAYDHELAKEVSKQLAVIEKETKNLKKIIEAIERIDKMTNVLDKVLAAAAQTTTFFTNPSSTAAAKLVSVIGAATSAALGNASD